MDWFNVQHVANPRCCGWFGRTEWPDIIFDIMFQWINKMIINITSLINHSKKQNGRILKAVDWIHLTQDRDQLWAPVNIVGVGDESVFFLFGAGARFLLSELKTYNCRRYSFSLCSFVFLFVYIFIRYFIICTILLFIIPSGCTTFWKVCWNRDT